MLEEAIERNTEAVIKLTEVMLQNDSSNPVIGEKPVVVDKPKRARRTKAEIDAEKNVGTENPPDLSLDGEQAKTSLGGVTTQAQMKAAGHRLVECGENQAGLAKAKEIMATHGFQKIDDVSEDKYNILTTAFNKEAENWGKSKANTAL